MKQYVDIQGAGELQTLIGSAITSSTNPCSVGTVRGANNAELRFLTVENIGDQCDAAIVNSGTSPRLTHVTFVNKDGADNFNTYGVYNDGASAPSGTSPTMSDVTVAVSGGGESVAVRNTNVTLPEMNNVTATAIGGGLVNYGVWNTNSSPTIKQSKLTGKDSSLLQGSGTAKVALTEFEGPIQRTGGTLRCFNNYDQNVAAVTCP